MALSVVRVGNWSCNVREQDRCGCLFPARNRTVSSQGPPLTPTAVSPSSHDCAENQCARDIDPRTGVSVEGRMKCARPVGWSMNVARSSDLNRFPALQGGVHRPNISADEPFLDFDRFDSTPALTDERIDSFVYGLAALEAVAQEARFQWAVGRFAFGRTALVSAFVGARVA